MKAVKSDIAWYEVLHYAVQHCGHVVPSTITYCLALIKMLCSHILLYLTVAVPGANVRSVSSSSLVRSRYVVSCSHSFHFRCRDWMEE